MKIELLPCHCTAEDASTHFNISHWIVGRYPLTYTAQECAEAWCEMVGWKFICFHEEYGLERYSMRVEVPVNENPSCTIIDNYYDFEDLGWLR